MTPQERYDSDSLFHGLVDEMLRKLMLGIRPSTLRDAAKLAAVRYGNGLFMIDDIEHVRDDDGKESVRVIKNPRVFSDADLEYMRKEGS